MTCLCLGEAIERDLHYRRGYSRTLWWIRVHQDILIKVSRPLHCFTGDLERCESKSRPGGRGGGGEADLHSSTQRISDQLLLLYRKIPIISPGLIQLREGCLEGLLNGEACIRRGEETIKKGLEKSYLAVLVKINLTSKAREKRPRDEVGSKFLFEQIKFTSIQARGGLIFGRGVITGCMFLFAGRWAYKWGGLISGRCL